MSFALKHVVLGLCIAFFDSQSLVNALSIQEPIQTRRDDYTYTPGVGAHKIYSRIASWNVARRTCEEDGAHLGIINSVAEAETVARLFNQTNLGHVWVGVHDLYQEDEFITIHGERLAQTGFDIWSPGMPDNYQNNENCVVLWPDAKLNDGNCALRIPFVCELREDRCNTETPFISR